MVFAFAITLGSTMQMEFMDFGRRRLASKHVAAPAATPSIPSPLFEPPLRLLRPLPPSLNLGLSKSSELRFLEAAVILDAEDFISELAVRGRMEDKL